jgi:hypothetical protein
MHDALRGLMMGNSHPKKARGHPSDPHQVDLSSAPPHRPLGLSAQWEALVPYLDTPTPFPAPEALEARARLKRHAPLLDALPDVASLLSDLATPAGNVQPQKGTATATHAAGTVHVASSQQKSANGQAPARQLSSTAAAEAAAQAAQDLERRVAAVAEALVTKGRTPLNAQQRRAIASLLLRCAPQQGGSSSQPVDLSGQWLGNLPSVLYGPPGTYPHPGLSWSVTCIDVHGVWKGAS